MVLHHPPRSSLGMVILHIYSWEKKAINDSKILNFLIWLLNYLHLHKLFQMSFYPCLSTYKIIMTNITWYLDCRGGEIMEIELTMWHTISARNQEVVRKSSFVVVSALSSNLSMLFFWVSVWQCGLMSERKGLWPWTIWVQILTLPLTSL